MTILRSGAKAGHALVEKSGNQSIARISTQTLTWETVVDDEYSMWSSGANTRLSVPSWVTLVQVGVSAEWAYNATAYRSTYSTKNGAAPHGRGSDQINHAGGCETTRSFWSAPLVVVGGTDYFEVRVYQNTAAALNMQISGGTWHSIIILGTT